MVLSAPLAETVRNLLPKVKLRMVEATSGLTVFTPSTTVGATKLFSCTRRRRRPPRPVENGYQSGAALTFVSRISFIAERSILDYRGLDQGAERGELLCRQPQRISPE